MTISAGDARNRIARLRFKRGRMPGSPQAEQDARDEHPDSREGRADIPDWNERGDTEHQPQPAHPRRQLPTRRMAKPEAISSPAAPAAMKTTETSCCSRFRACAAAGLSLPGMSANANCVPRDEPATDREQHRTAERGYRQARGVLGAPDVIAQVAVKEQAEQQSEPGQVGRDLNPSAMGVIESDDLPSRGVFTRLVTK
jgi:hypothetical protein